jgi:CP family cyanate transporter-like MFS transporter
MTTDTRVRTGTAVMLIGVLLVGANLRVGITPVGPVIQSIRDSLHLPASTASILTSLPLLAFALISPLAPAVSRRFGIQRTLGLALGLLIVAIVVRSLPVAPALWIGTALLGIAIAVLNVVLPSLVKQEFPDRVGQVTGLYSAAQSIFAAIAAGLAVPVAAAAAGGWRTSLVIWAGLAIVALVFIAPQFRAGSNSSRGAAAPIHGVPGGASPWRSALGWQVTLFMGLQSTVYYVLITWLPSVEKTNGVSAAQAGFHQLLLNAFAIAGSLGVSTVIRRLPDQRIVAVGSSILMAIGITITMAFPTVAAVGVSISGIGVGASIVLALSLFGLRTAHPLEAARLSGMAQSIGYLLAAAGPILIGVLHDATGSWTIAIGVLFPVLVGQLIVGVLAGRARVL